MMKIFVVAPIMVWLNGCGSTTRPAVQVGPAAITPAPATVPERRQTVIDIPLLPPVKDTCSGNQLGLYSWGYEVWNSPTSPLVSFLRNPAVKEYGCGDLYINVADYSATTYIKDEAALVPFIKNVRSSGNQAVVFLVYGDVDVGKNGAENGPTEFADTFFRWISSIPDSDLKTMLPLGVSYDCEHLSVRVIENALKRAQELKRILVNQRLGGDASLIQIEWTVEGQEKPVDTDMVMRLADRALVMSYRTHMGKSVKDPLGEDNMVTRLFDFMFTKQCRHCLDDAYATANYKAKIRIMFEADCQCGNGCGKISFCAYDAKESGWGENHPNGAAYLMSTLQEFDTELRHGGRLSSSQYSRLFGAPTNLQLFVVHNWQWFTCFFDDPSVAVTTPIGRQRESCKNYHSMARACRSK